MKKFALLLILLSVFTLTFTSCKTPDMTEAVIGSSYQYAGKGFYGDFIIDIKEDGTFSYYEGMASSYKGLGRWEIKGNKITLSDKFFEFKNSFKIEADKLIWLEDESTGFMYMKLEDKAVFFKK